MRLLWAYTLQRSHGAPMGLQWSTHGSPMGLMGLPWISHESLIPMGLPWDFHESLVLIPPCVSHRFLWVSHAWVSRGTMGFHGYLPCVCSAGPSATCESFIRLPCASWVPHGSHGCPMDVLWGSHGLWCWPMGTAWLSHWTLQGLAWVCSAPMGLQWVSHGFLVGLPSILHGFHMVLMGLPLDFRGNPMRS